LTHIRTVGVLFWEPGHGISTAIACALQQTGSAVERFAHDAVVPPGLDAIIACGPFSSLAPLGLQLQRIPRGGRPELAVWLTEPLPDPGMPEPIRRLLGEMRSAVDRLAYREMPSGQWNISPTLAVLARRGFRFRYYGDLHWLRRKEILSVLATTSNVWRGFLEDRGFSAITAYMGSDPEWGADLGTERDIPVLWLGKVATRRRKRLLGFVRSELARRGIDLLVIDGVEHPYVFGAERTKLLNRTCIALNLLREAFDDNSMRYFIAAPNRALIVTEPTLPHTPFVPGTHLVQSTIDQLPDTICYYLKHQEERTRITENAYRLVTDELTLDSSVRAIVRELEHAGE